MPEDKKTKTKRKTSLFCSCSSATTAAVNILRVTLHVTLVLVSLANQMSTVKATSEMAQSSQSVGGAAGENNILNDRRRPGNSSSSATSWETFESPLLLVEQIKGLTMEQDKNNDKGKEEGLGRRRRSRRKMEQNNFPTYTINDEETKKKEKKKKEAKGGEPSQFTAELSDASASATSLSSDTAAAAAGFPPVLSTRPTSITSTLSAETSRRGATSPAAATSDSYSPPATTAASRRVGIMSTKTTTTPTKATKATGISGQKTVVEQRKIIMGERIITPLPLINRPPDASYTSSSSSSSAAAAFRGVQQNTVNSRNQSSSHSHVNDLQVDEKHFLNEIVKNFNKSIVLNSFEFSPSATTSLAAASSTMATNETGTALTSTNHVPRAGDTAAAAVAATEPSNSPILNSLRTHARSHGGGAVGGGSGVSSSSGSTNRNLVPKIHYHKSDSAMLNYIFDSHVKHRHSDMRFGPHFVQSDDIELLNSSAVLGGVGLMSCKISQLQDKTVSWVRRLADTNEMLLLTVGPHTYSSDARFRVDFQYPDDWRLRIDNATKADEGTYVCQISTHPPQAIQTNFYVSSPEVLIVDEQGLPLSEKFYNLDSLLELNCIVNHITMLTSVVHWYHGDVSLNYDATRGGIRVGTNLTEDAANSTLWVARVKPADSGNYTCSVGPHLFFTTSVHVLNESLAELHHGDGARHLSRDGLWLVALCIILLLRTTELVTGMEIPEQHLMNAMPVAGQTHIR